MLNGYFAFDYLRFMFIVTTNCRLNFSWKMNKIFSGCYRESVSLCFVRKSANSIDRGYNAVSRIRRLLVQSTGSICVCGTASWLSSSEMKSKFVAPLQLIQDSPRRFLFASLASFECMNWFYDTLIIDRSLRRNSKFASSQLSKLKFIFMSARYPSLQLVFNIAIYYLASNFLIQISSADQCFTFLLLYLQTRAIARVTSTAVHCLLRAKWKMLPKTPKSIGFYLIAAQQLKENRNTNLSIEHNGFVFSVKGETLFQIIMGLEFVGFLFSGHFPKYAFAHEGNIAALLTAWNLTPF